MTMTRRTFIARSAAAGSILALGSAASMLRRVSQVSAQTQVRGRWSNRAPLPLPRTEISLAELDGKLYVLGGYAEGRVDQPINQVYDPVTDAWRTLAPMPRGLNHVGVVGFNGKIYA